MIARPYNRCQKYLKQECDRTPDLEAMNPANLATDFNEVYLSYLVDELDAILSAHGKAVAAIRRDRFHFTGLR